MNTINFYNADATFKYSQKKYLKKFLKKLFQNEKKETTSINYIFCSDAYLLDINIKFLKHDFYTDIITFILSDEKNSVEAEIYISIERVKENAKTLTLTYQIELLRVIFHGALHLCGYDDKNEIDKLQMRHKEDEYLEKYFDVSREN